MTCKIITNAAAGALVLLLGMPAIAAPQQYDRDRREYRSDRLTTQGRITSMVSEGDRFRVTLDHGAYTYFVPRSTARAADLRIGSRVRLGGIVNGDFVTVDVLAFPGDPHYVNDPYYQAVPRGSNGWMSGTVERVNRHLGYMTIREDSTGNFVKIDVRHINMRRPINVWDIRTGDHITVNGGWENRDTFDATRVEY